jgi:hypothetical protein
MSVFFSAFFFVQYSSSLKWIFSCNSSVSSIILQFRFFSKYCLSFHSLVLFYQYFISYVSHVHNSMFSVSVLSFYFSLFIFYFFIGVFFFSHLSLLQSFCFQSLFLHYSQLHQLLSLVALICSVLSVTVLLAQCLSLSLS